MAAVWYMTVEANSPPSNEHVLGTGTVQRASFLQIVLEGTVFIFFTGKKIKTWESEVTCPRPYSKTKNRAVHFSKEQEKKAVPLKCPKRIGKTFVFCKFTDSVINSA